MTAKKAPVAALISAAFLPGCAAFAAFNWRNAQGCFNAYVTVRITGVFRCPFQER